MYRFGLIMAGVLCAGCASIVSDTTSAVNIQSLPPNASYEVHNHKGLMVQQGITPHTVTLKKKRGYFRPARYTVLVKKEGYADASFPIRTRISWWYAGNLVFGGLTGLLIVDPATGAMWHLDKNPPQVTLHEWNPQEQPTTEQPTTEER
jgi:hypothetical protein